MYICKGVKGLYVHMFKQCDKSKYNIKVNII